ncbi:MAG TPA: GNAT family N-acetyltransferase [Gemmatimonadales bacterium]|jgi:[ribosomal protein S5]-alanine N-acetyltransferase|nr:GNAT family N-acetyltransferase [Gemmatimonadales bacterium]
MMAQRVGTERLELAPLTLDEVDALLAGDEERLRALTGVLFPRPVAPPPYMTDPLPTVRERLRARPDQAPWWNWLMFERETKRAVGSVAFGGPPDAAGSVLIGYAMYAQFEGHGYATEAVKAMIDWSFRQPGVRQVRTLAPVWNTPALRVAENVGMRPVAADEDDDVGEVLVYAVSAPASVGSA